MAADDFSIRVEGVSAFERRLGKLLASFGDLLPLMDRLGQYLVESTRHRFETNVAPDGTPWKPSQRATLEGGQTLVKDGHLRDSITHLPSPNSVEWGSNLVYARPHQLGAVIHPVSADALVFKLPGGLGTIHTQEVILPKREFLGISIDDEIGIERVTDRFIEAMAA